MLGVNNAIYSVISLLRSRTGLAKCDVNREVTVLPEQKNILSCCCSVGATISKPYTYTGIQNLPFRLSGNLSIHHYCCTAFLQAFTPACILHRTSTRSCSDILPTRYTKFFTCLVNFPSSLMFNSCLCFPTNITSLLELHL